MKRINTVREILGLTQHDMAMLLRIGRSQWSMYELGKRELPTAAQVLLADILMHVKSAETEAKTEIHLKQQQEHSQKSLESLLRENQYQRLHIAREIAALEKKHTAHIQLSSVVDFLKIRNEGKENDAIVPLHPLVNKVSQGLTSAELASVMQYRHTLEVLELEKALLESKMQQVVGSEIEMKFTN